MLAQVHSVTWQRNRQWPVALPTPEGLPPPPPPCKPYWAGKEGEGLRGQGACLESHSERHGVVLAEGGGPPYRHRALGAEPTSWPAPLPRPSGAARGLGAVTAPRSQRLLPGQRPRVSGGSPGGCPPASAGPGCRLSRLCHVAQGPQLPRRGQEHIRVPPAFLGLSPEATSLLPAISQSQRRRSPAQLRGAGRCGARAPGEQWAFPGTATLRSRGTRKPPGVSGWFPWPW